MSIIMHTSYDSQSNIDRVINPTIEDILLYFELFIERLKQNKQIKKRDTPLDIYFMNQTGRAKEVYDLINSTDVCVATRAVSMNLKTHIDEINFCLACCYFFGYTKRESLGGLVFEPNCQSKTNITDEIINERYNNLSEVEQFTITLTTGYINEK